MDTCLAESFYPDRFPIRNRSDVFKLLWVGGLHSRKALPIAIEVIKKMKSPAKLLIVGDGPLREKLKILINDPVLYEKIEWWGQVSWDRVKEAYLLSDVFLFTSLRESFGSQLVEAMAFGLPIITLNLHGARDWVPKNAGIKVEVGSHKSTVNRLVSSIQRLYQSPDQCSAMGKIGYEFAMRQKWSRKARSMSLLYEYAIRNQT